MVFLFDRMRTAILLCICCSLVWLISCTVQAEEPLLPAQQAFVFSSESSNAQSMALHWKIAPNYYLYQHKVTLHAQQKQQSLQFPPATSQHDDTFGRTLVYFNQLDLNLQSQPNTTYEVSWQGCAKDRLCYPPQHTQFKTDADGLVIAENKVMSQNSVFDQALHADRNPTFDSVPSTLSHPVGAQAPSEHASDQHWANRLEQHSLGYGLALFLGLGILLAFTPCSLPMLPIVSSLIIRDRQGRSAWMVAGVFVLSMAAVYALLGLLASYIGLGFQRWLQQPATLMALSGLFVIFALNLFGLFEIKLPVWLTTRLDRLQSSQKGGSFLGAMVMGAVSALLVGPCMTAPLAGALLFIAQTQNQWYGAALLFVLGLGMGIPLLLISILGSRFLPKAGMWMNQVKIIFAFIMLGLAIYFIRPLLSVLWLHWLIQALYLAVILYAAYAIYKQVMALKIGYAILLGAVVIAAGVQQVSFNQQSQNLNKQQEWHVATDEASFKQLLAQAPQGQPVVIDVYADWCVACQPIEHGILTQPSIQNALQPYYLIKLDLSQYNASQQRVLTQWAILGPPTYVFLDALHQERRDLRLTGEFSQEQLLIQLKQLVP